MKTSHLLHDNTELNKLSQLAGSNNWQIIKISIVVSCLIYQAMTNEHTKVATEIQVVQERLNTIKKQVQENSETKQQQLEKLQQR